MEPIIYGILDSVKWNSGVELWNEMVNWNGIVDWNDGQFACYDGSAIVGSTLAGLHVQLIIFCMCQLATAATNGSSLYCTSLPNKKEGIHDLPQGTILQINNYTTTVF